MGQLEFIATDSFADRCWSTSEKFTDIEKSAEVEYVDSSTNCLRPLVSRLECNMMEEIRCIFLVWLAVISLYLNK